MKYLKIASGVKLVDVGISKYDILNPILIRAGLFAKTKVGRGAKYLEFGRNLPAP